MKLRELINEQTRGYMWSKTELESILKKVKTLKNKLTSHKNTDKTDYTYRDLYEELTGWVKKLEIKVKSLAGNDTKFLWDELDELNLAAFSYKIVNLQRRMDRRYG